MNAYYIFMNFFVTFIMGDNIIRIKSKTVELHHSECIYRYYRMALIQNVILRIKYKKKKKCHGECLKCFEFEYVYI